MTVRETRVVFHLSVAATKLRRGQDMRQSTKTMEQHGYELNDQNQSEEEDKH